MITSQDEHYMRRALALARRGAGWVSPNPMVGAVIVKGGRVIAEGYHRRFGGDHAEVEAIKRARESLKGATMYVTLEPCCHWGKTPPCTEAIIREGIGRVVVATLDPNPEVRGKGVKVLREAGLEVKVGVLEEEARELNEAYFKWREEGVPFVTLKWAQSIDGRIATRKGDSRWISSEEARRLAHRLRARSDAVLVGIRTVLADDPQLTVREARGKNPLRVVLDSRLKTPLGARVLDSSAPTLIVTTHRADPGKMRALQERTEVLVMEGKDGRVDLGGLLRELARRAITSVLVEGGGRIITSFLREGLWDRILVITSPLLIGEGVDAVGNLGVSSLKEAKGIRVRRMRRLGRDWVLEGRRPSSSR